MPPVFISTACSDLSFEALIRSRWNIKYKLIWKPTNLLEKYSIHVYIQYMYIYSTCIYNTQNQPFCYFTQSIARRFYLSRESLWVAFPWQLIRLMWYINIHVYIFIYKISGVLRKLWLVSCRVYIRLCKHSCDIMTYFLVLFHKWNRKCTLYTLCLYNLMQTLEQVWENFKVLM